METITADYFESANLPYRLPSASKEVGGRGIEHLRNRLVSIATPDYLKPTGLEDLTNEAFQELANTRNIFGHAKTIPTFLNAPWSTMLSEEGLAAKEAAPFRDFLYKELSGKPLIELGAGDNGPRHAWIFRTLFGVKSYHPVDMQEKVIEYDGTQADALSYLQACPHNSANIAAFGLFNEPMSPIYGHSAFEFMWPARTPEVSTRRQCEQEYLRRLAKEIHRVLPKGGLLFGDGLHPIRVSRDFEYFLQGNGIKHVGEGYVSLLKAGDVLQAGDPYFMRKI